jgi:hypothetical protein
MMSWKIKLIYLAVLLAIVYPLLQWNKQIAIPVKQALLPPDLPFMPQRNNELLNTMLAHNLWDQNHQKLAAKNNSQQTKKKKQKSKEWALEGIGYKQEGNAIAVITANGETKNYRETDELPDGSTIEKILINSITVKKEGEERNVYLFKEN